MSAFLPTPDEEARAARAECTDDARADEEAAARKPFPYHPGSHHPLYGALLEARADREPVCAACGQKLVQERSIRDGICLDCREARDG